MLPATLYTPPNGDTQEINIANVFPEDANWFNSQTGHVSLEELSTGDVAVYYDTGLTDDENEPIEFTVLSFGRGCHETLAELRSVSQRYLEEHQ